MPNSLKVIEVEISRLTGEIDYWKEKAQILRKESKNALRKIAQLEDKVVNDSEIQAIRVTNSKLQAELNQLKREYRKGSKISEYKLNEIKKIINDEEGPF